MTDFRLMLQLVPSTGAGDLTEALESATLGTKTTILTRSPQCFIGAASSFAASLELRFEKSDAGRSLATTVRACGALGDHVDRPASVALVGHDVVFVDKGAAAVRYQYLMRRRPELTHAAYLHHYETCHSRFGRRTPNIERYTQLHVDLDASAELAAATGLAGPVADSVSELHLRSVAHFLDGISAHPEVGVEAREDEEHFVDRARSQEFVNEIRRRHP